MDGNNRWSERNHINPFDTYIKGSKKLLEISEDYGFRDFYAILTDSYPKGSDKSKVRDKLYYGYLITAMISTLMIIFLKLRK